ncbi:MAG TPA: exopolysaccharide biosynthesis protein [Caulobacteraceae bacterium]|jgi:hypothetical protein
MAKDAPSRDLSLAERLKPLLREEEPRIRLDEMVGRIEGREGLAPVLFVLTLPVMLPLPPGVSMVMAIPILLVAPQLMLGRRRLWLPGWLARLTIKHGDLARLLKRVLPTLERIERLVRPRLPFLTGRIGAFDVGVASTVIGVILVTPLPFANLLPSWSLCAFSLGLTRRDGAFVLVGYLLLAAALAVIALAVLGVDFGVGRLRALI